MVLEICVVYLAVISLVSVIVCIADKHRAKISGARRVLERMLFILSALGGSAAMLVTMLLIRHKTRHLRFMIGIPAIMVAQYALVWAFVMFLR